MINTLLGWAIVIAILYFGIKFWLLPKIKRKLKPFTVAKEKTSNVFSKISERGNELLKQVKKRLKKDDDEKDDKE